MQIPPKGWVSPFGYPRIKAYSQLPTAFRSVSRPSSPLSTKASTKCPYLTLDRNSYRSKYRSISLLLEDSTEVPLLEDANIPRTKINAPYTPESANRTIDPFTFLTSSQCQRSTCHLGTNPWGPVSCFLTRSSPMPDGHAFLRRAAPQGRHEGLVWRLHADRRTNPIFALQALKLVGQGRLELPTSRLSSARSNQLSY